MSTASAGTGPREREMKAIWIHTMNDDGIIMYQGRLVKCLPDGGFQIEAYSWLTGEPNGEMTLPRGTKVALYPSDREMRAAWARQEAHRKAKPAPA